MPKPLPLRPRPTPPPTDLRHPPHFPGTYSPRPGEPLEYPPSHRVKAAVVILSIIGAFCLAVVMDHAANHEPILEPAPVVVPPLKLTQEQMVWLADCVLSMNGGGRAHHYVVADCIEQTHQLAAIPTEVSQ